MIGKESYEIIMGALERAHGLAEERQEQFDILRAGDELRTAFRAQQVASDETPPRNGPADIPDAAVDAVRTVLAELASGATSPMCVCGEPRYRGPARMHEVHEVVAAIAGWLRSRPGDDPEIRGDAGHWQRATDWAADLLDGGRRG